MAKNIFYKRHYTLDPVTKELTIRKKEGQQIKEKIDLSLEFSHVDKDLQRQLCTDYRRVFQSYFNAPIKLP